MSERIRKVNSVIEHEVTLLIQHRVDFKLGVFATVAKVDTARDLSYAKVYVSVFPTGEKDYAMNTLKNEHRGIQKILHKKLHMKVLPKIQFVYSEVGERFDELEGAIHEENF